MAARIDLCWFPRRALRDMRRMASRIRGEIGRRVCESLPAGEEPDESLPVGEEPDVSLPVGEEL